MSSELRNFLSLSYDELEQLNLEAKEQRKNRVSAHKIQEERIKYLTDEKRIKACLLYTSLRHDGIRTGGLGLVGAHRLARPKFCQV